LRRRVLEELMALNTKLRETMSDEDIVEKVTQAPEL
jgi:hypothetical protein